MVVLKKDYYFEFEDFEFEDLENNFEEELIVLVMMVFQMSNYSILILLDKCDQTVTASVILG